MKNKLFKNIQDFKDQRNNYIKNRYYFVNNNVVQYSSYIVIDEDHQKNVKYQIESIIELSYINVTDFGSKENFTCILKSFKNQHNIEIIELKAIDSVEINRHKKNKKLIFNLKLEDFEEYLKNPKDFNLEHLAIAVIWKFDFNKSLEKIIFEHPLDQFEIHNQRCVMPYSLIRFQIPEIIKVQIKRLPSVGICTSYLYGNIPPELLNWVEFNLEFGFSEIMLYDGTIKKEMSRVNLFVFFYTFIPK